MASKNPNPTHGHRFPKTLQRVEEMEAKKVSESTDHDIYNCPYCYDKEVKYMVKDPKPDTKGSLYIHKQKNIGFCHRCATVVVTKWSVEDALDKLADALGDLARGIDVEDLPSVNLDGYKKISESPKAIEYLSGRNPFITPGVADALGMRFYSRFHTERDADGASYPVLREGVIAPMKHMGIEKSFQIRFITKDKKRRFYTMDGLKMLYVPIEPPVGATVTLCEGVYDAIALLQMKFPYPIAILGKSMTPMQERHLRQYVPTAVNICLDDPKLNYELERHVKRSVATVSQTKKWLFNWMDPEEYMLKNPTAKYDDNWKVEY